MWFYGEDTSTLKITRFGQLKSLIRVERLVCIYKKWVSSALLEGATLLGRFFCVNNGHVCLSRHHYTIYCTFDGTVMLVLFAARWGDGSYCYRNNKVSASILWRSTNFKVFLTPENSKPDSWSFQEKRSSINWWSSCKDFRNLTDSLSPFNFNTYATILLHELDYTEMLEEVIFNNFCNLSFINTNSELFIACFFCIL